MVPVLEPFDPVEGIIVALARAADQGDDVGSLRGEDQEGRRLWFVPAELLCGTEPVVLDGRAASGAVRQATGRPVLGIGLAFPRSERPQSE